MGCRVFGAVVFTHTHTLNLSAGAHRKWSTLNSKLNPFDVSPVVGSHVSKKKLRRSDEQINKFQSDMPGMLSGLQLWVSSGVSALSQR